MAKSKNDVFVSYDHDDARMADRITADLTKNGVAVWIDEGHLRAGHPLITKVQDAITMASRFVLLWSKHASASRWVNAEWNAAWHLKKNIIPCALDKTPVPLFLRDIVRCTFSGVYQKGLAELLSALTVRIKPKPKAHPPRSPHVLVEEIYTGQDRLLQALGAGSLHEAKKEQKDLDTKVQQGLKENPADADLLNLAAYHQKNAFQIKHWNALQMGQYPKDKTLSEAEVLFYKSLAIEPDNPSAINGLGSVLALRGDVDAAEFFVRRAIDLAKKQGLDYGYAKDDLAMIRRLQKEKI